MYDIQTDVAIIGAGPAGSSTSLFLSKAGVNHVIFDKAVFPRDKICGDALSGKVLSVLKSYDPGLIEEMEIQKDIFLESWGVQFYAPNRKVLEIPFRKNNHKEPHAPGFIAKRMDFDHFLTQKLDTGFADIHHGTEITGINRHEKGVDLTFSKNGHSGTCHCKVVVGAEGDRSLIAKNLAGHRMDPAHYSAGVRAYYKNVGGHHPGNFIELHFIKEILPGYLWIFPMADNMANVGIGILSGNMRNKSFNMKKEMLQLLSGHEEFRTRFKDARLIGDIKGWGLPLGSKKRQISGDRFLLTGDAGSLIDPFTGEGIGNALVSGEIAAKVIKQAVDANNYSGDFLTQYDTAIYNRLWDELRLSYTIQRLVKFPWLFNFVVNRANNNPAVKDVFTYMFDDLNLRALLRSPSFYLRLLFNF